MAVLGTGYIPAAGAVASELTAVTRRAFVEACVVQIGTHSPVLAAALANSQTASGGVSSVTVPLQGAALTTPQYTDYSGTFTRPTGQTGLQNAEYNLKVLVVPVQFLGMEGLVQFNAAVVPILAARMNDAGNQAAGQLATDLATNTTEGLTLDGMPMICSATATVGNIDPTAAGNGFWVANARSALAGVAPTRQTVLNDIVSATSFNGGEAPTMGVTDFGTWEKLAEDYVGQEVYQITPGSSFSDSALGPQSAFTALMVAGVPVYADANYPTTGTSGGNATGTIYYWQPRYSAMYIHEMAAFVFTGWQSTQVVGQLGYEGLLVVALEFLTTKRKSWTSRGGYLSNSLA